MIRIQYRGSVTAESSEALLVGVWPVCSSVPKLCRYCPEIAPPSTRAGLPHTVTGSKKGGR